MVVFPHSRQLLLLHRAFLARQRRFFIQGLFPSTVKQVYKDGGRGAVFKHMIYQIPRAVVVLGIIGCLMWVPYNRKRLVDGHQIYHAWIATQAAYSENPAAFINRPEIRRNTDFLSVCHLDLHKGDVRLVLLETFTTMYLAIRGPLKDQAQIATRTNSLDATDTTAADLSHSALHKYMEGIPVEQVWEDTNMFDRHLVICGHGVGGMIAHMLLLKELYSSHVSSTLHRIRSLSFGSPFFLAKKARDDVNERGWRRMFMNVINKADPYPSIISALLNPNIKNSLDEKSKGQLEQVKTTLTELMSDVEDNPKLEAKREALEKQFLAQWKTVRSFLPAEEAEVAHFDPLGNYMFMDPAGNLPQPDKEYAQLPSTQMVVWKRGDLRQAFYDRAAIDSPQLKDGRKRSYTATITELFKDSPSPAVANRRLPVLAVNFPIYVHSKFL